LIHALLWTVYGPRLPQVVGREGCFIQVLPDNLLGIFGIASAGEQLGGLILRGATIRKAADVFCQVNRFQDDGPQLRMLALSLQ
jgi:hypothetical protein